MVPFDEVSYRKFMETTVSGWLSRKVERGYLTSFDGTKIAWYKAVPEHPRGRIVLVHGFCEFFGKYHELAYNLYEKGYAVFFPEQRGHGYSDRSVPEIDRVDVLDFYSYVKDLKVFMDEVVLPELNSEAPFTEKPILFAHSMGGAVGALFLEDFPEYFSAAILNAPMLKINPGSFHPLQVKLLIFISKVLGWHDKLMPGQGVWDNKPDFENSGCLSRERYTYPFHLRQIDEHNRMYGGTYNWGRTAYHWTDILRQKKRMSRVQIPVLICQAGKDTFVSNDGQEQFARAAKKTTIVRFPDSKHEIFNGDESILKDYYPAIFDFLEAEKK